MFLQWLQILPIEFEKGYFSLGFRIDRRGSIFLKRLKDVLVVNKKVADYFQSEQFKDQKFYFNALCMLVKELVFWED